ncbi:LacI family DNA-binding transcriptional regulator [Schleiferilactobacillus harbinensis]|uniref:LacI family DNA-binding transcriptional regulator n=1 Tax=Schleiferilactobacillus harbinensis TaxID=304207 RepID=UPI00242E2F74|nr:LacI family DNA-binding transcriptional regulator [Schleiferilactobacillus harbinensis]MCI1687903.1 LacI family DNA-binding transcriptional regulator [Schleiferilactobacillus harbinensis]MCI1783205.1 LacI family DNA-binding transcriptional regulator [Schleiferilactobacillus harbinensis]MCI1849818.1 LacI family DNA-binding transcriptional regulator [Schleiferilactobacillus harbinensis]
MKAFAYYTESRKKKTTTIKDIANKAGVSISTVSRILNFDTTLSVTDATRARVLHVAEEMEYKPRRKKTPKTTTKIAVIQWHSEKQELNDLYYLQIQYAIENTVQSSGAALQYVTTENFNEAVNSTFSGIIALGKYGHQEMLDIAAKKLPVVFVGQNSLADGFDSVTSDYVSPVKWIIDHYLAAGIQDIGLIVGQEATSIGHQEIKDTRLQAFETFGQAAGVYTPEHVFVGAFTPESGYALMNEAIDQLGDKLPHGFIVGNDAMAVGVIRALNEQDLPIPERVSLISFNDVAVAKYTSPRLSTVHAYTDLMGAGAVQLLQERISDPKRVARQFNYATKLILRESSK